MKNKLIKTLSLALVILTAAAAFTACSNKNGGGAGTTAGTSAATSNSSGETDHSTMPGTSDTSSATGTNGGNANSETSSAAGTNGGNTTTADEPTGTLDEIVQKIYDNSGITEWPMLATTEINKENMEYFLGTADLDIKEGIASEPMISAIAHSVCLVRMNENADIEAAKTMIMDKVDPRKWVCVEVDKKDVRVVSRGNLIALIMVNDQADALEKAFMEIK